jgi:branched-chain amino acid transport system substrate-binding protein
VKVQFTLVVGAVAALLLAGGCQAAAGPVETVTIGADLELTGPDAAIGKVYAQALNLRVEQINQEGLLGNRKLKVLRRDNRSDPATSAANIQVLVADPSVRALVTGVCDDCVIASAKTINDAKIPTIALSLGAKVATPVAERKYIFKLAPSAADDASLLAGELEQVALRKVAVMSGDDSFGNDAADEIRNKVERSGGSLVARENVGAEPDKVVAAVGRVVARKPDAVVVMSFAPQSSQLAKSLRDGGYTGRIFFGSPAADNLFLSGDTAAAMNNANMVFTPTLVSDDIIATSPAKATRVAWFRDYLSKFGTYGAYASFGADAAEVLAQAIRQTNSTDRDQLRTAVETTRMDGLSGPLRLTPDNHSALAPQAVTMLVAANGRWRLAS